MKRSIIFFLLGSLLVVPSLTSAVRDVPFSRNYKCFWETKNENLRMCRKFYNTICSKGADVFSDLLIPPAPIATNWSSSQGVSGPESSRLVSTTRCPKSLACPKFTNPVYDKKGAFYPSACWAEHFGVTDYTYGISERTRNFVSELWKEHGYIVPKPSVEFSYNGSGNPEFKNGVFARSAIWKDDRTLLALDFNIHTDRDKSFSSSLFELTLMKPPFGRRKILLAFVIFEKAYPDYVLLNLTSRYTRVMNNYFRKKQQIKNPVQFDITPVIISPPRNLDPPSARLSPQDREKIYRAAIQKASNKDFDIFIFTPVGNDPYSGYYTALGEKEKEFISAPLRFEWEYSTQDKESGIRSLWHFQDTFGTISHELLHALGLSADHVPMETYFTDFVGMDVDHITGKSHGKASDGDIDPQKECDFYGTSPDYYALKLPSEFRIRVGKEPDWAIRVESETGSCIFPDGRRDGMLKDKNDDGYYEIMYKNNLIGIELQRMLGWVDVDGDGIAELDDPDPYGGMKSVFPR